MLTLDIVDEGHKTSSFCATSKKRWILPSAGPCSSRIFRAFSRFSRWVSTEKIRNHILDFHVRFEEIFPFEDGSGRVGRALMFKECLRHDVIPFIIDDKRCSRYLRGIKEWHTDRYELADVVMEAQDRFVAQIELQKLYSHTRLYLPADYTED